MTEIKRLDRQWRNEKGFDVENWELTYEDFLRVFLTDP